VPGPEESIFWIALCAVLAPLLAALLLRGKVPEVVLLLVLGVVIGPNVLDLAATGEGIEMLRELGLGMLFLLAGYEIEVDELVGKGGRRALATWIACFAVALGLIGLIGLTDAIHAEVAVAIALTSTALGTLLPILREQDMLKGVFGRFIFAAGAVGELFPILAISLFLGAYKTWWEALIIASIAGLALLLAWLTHLLAGTKVGAIINENKNATSQSTLRITVVLLVGLLLITERFGVEAALGAFFAGMVLRQTASDDPTELDEKLDAVGYGFFIPVFFVSSGMALDVVSIVENPIRLLVFFALLLVVRGLPSLLVYRKTLPFRQRVEMMFLTATALPLLVALAAIGVDSGVMLPENAAALVGAGVLSVAIFPFIATRMHQPAGSPAALDRPAT
jgi:Kef-type K+ transport system membrane component KefB